MQTKKNLVIGGALLAATLLVAGCAPDCVSVPYVPGVNNSEKVGGHFLDRSVKVSNLYITSQKNNTFRGQATLSNLTSDRQSLRYRFEWMRGDGQPAGYYSPWQPVVLYPSLSQVVTAMNRGGNQDQPATNFVVQVCHVESD